MSKKRWYRVEVEFKVSGIVFVKEIDKIMVERAVKKAQCNHLENQWKEYYGDNVKRNHLRG